jgi:tRNA uridine 5-carbamoylmethylation protein Kti12
LTKLLICMMGLPRSGKTTIVKELMKKHQAPVVRRDDIRLALHNQRYQSKAEPFVKAISDVMIRSLFLSGHDVVICDETNYSRAARDFHRSSEWRTVFYEVPTSPEVCKERALLTNQPDLLPVIDAMYQRLEALAEDEERYEKLEWRENATPTLLRELQTLIDEANNKATRNIKEYYYTERGKGQLDFALDLQRIVEKYAS